MTMSPEQLEDFRHLLHEQMRTLLEEAKDTVEGMHEAVKDSYADPGDRALLESSRNNALRMRDRERKLISKVQEAIDRIDAGIFGICEECGEEIGSERLRVRPVTTHCIECKEEQERKENRL